MSLPRNAFTLIYILIFGSVPLGLRINLYPLTVSNSITFDLGRFIFLFLFSMSNFVNGNNLRRT